MVSSRFTNFQLSHSKKSNSAEYLVLELILCVVCSGIVYLEAEAINMKAMMAVVED